MFLSEPNTFCGKVNYPAHRAGHLKKLNEGDCIPLPPAPHSSPSTGRGILREGFIKMKGRVMSESAKQKEFKTVKRWTFLTNHALVLLFVARHHRITARELCLELGITVRAARMIIANLEEAGYLQKIREGR